MTIIIPAYNCRKTLGRTLNSLINQQDHNFSVIIVDDNSTENFLDIIDTFKQSLNITYLRNSTNLGCGGSRRTGIDFIGLSDDYILFLDSDDILLPNAIQDFKRIINDHPEVDLIISPFIAWNTSYCTNIKPFYYSMHDPKIVSIYMMHGKVYSTKYLNKYHIYEDTRVGFRDDFFFNIQAFGYLPKCEFIVRPTYLYLINKGSNTHNMQIDINSADRNNKYDFQHYHSQTLKIITDISKQLNVNLLLNFCNMCESISKTYNNNLTNLLTYLNTNIINNLIINKLIKYN